MGLRYNSTISIKEKVCSCGCGRKGQIFSKGLLKEGLSRSKGKPINKISDRRKALEIGNESEDNVIDDLDMVVSLYIRIRDSNENGFLTCCTCPNEVHYKDADAGHWLSRGNMSVRWNENNIAGQCRTCNRAKYGEQDKFAEYIENKHKGMTAWLTEQSRIQDEELNLAREKFSFDKSQANKGSASDSTAAEIKKIIAEASKLPADKRSQYIQSQGYAPGLSVFEGVVPTPETPELLSLGEDGMPYSYTPSGGLTPLNMPEQKQQNGGLLNSILGWFGN